MESEPATRRVVLKLSGNAFGPAADGPFDSDALSFIAGEIAKVHRDGVQLGVVCGAGNIIRGAALCPEGPGRIRADYAGMLATLVNSLVLQGRLERMGIPCTCYTAVPAGRMAEAFEPGRCIADLRSGRVALLAGGTGNPLFTTDTAAALRAVELGAGIVLKATRVDGVFSDDPETNPEATRYSRLTYREVLEQGLGVIDLTAVSFCMEHGVPLLVFNYAVQDNIRRAAAGEAIGTFIGSEEDAS